MLQYNHIEYQSYKYWYIFFISNQTRSTTLWRFISCQYSSYFVYNTCHRCIFILKKNKLLNNVLSKLYNYFIDKKLQHSDDSIVCLPHVISCLSRKSWFKSDTFNNVTKVYQLSIFLLFCLQYMYMYNFCCLRTIYAKYSNSTTN
jgi:hypothetical protein